MTQDKVGLNDGVSISLEVYAAERLEKSPLKKLQDASSESQTNPSSDEGTSSNRADGDRA